jgi:sec-independent protein translocase protein TatC
MDSEQEELPPDPNLHPDDEEEGGGPVKSFLEHLEDLRWMLLKCIAAILVAMLVCLVGGNFLVKLLTWPLIEAQYFRLSQDRSVPIHLGTNVVAKVPLGEIAGTWGTNSPKSFRLVPFLEGTNVFLKLDPDLQPWAPPSKTMVILKTYGPLSGIMVAMKLALYGGLVAAAPFILFFVGQFVLPALKLTEKKLLYQIVSFGSVLFFTGVAFCYFVITAIALSATVQFSEWLGFGADEWRAEEYISFMCKFMLGTGLSFELPVVILTIVKIGLLDYVQLKKFRSYWIVIALIISAFVTPSGDPVTMLLMALPLWVLYEVSVWVAYVWNRRDRKREEAERKREEEEINRQGGTTRET